MQGFPGCSVGEDTARNAGDLVRSLGQEDPLEKEMTAHSSILAWKIHGQRNLAGYSPWDLKESDTIERLTLSTPTYTPYR